MEIPLIILLVITFIWGYKQLLINKKNQEQIKEYEKIKSAINRANTDYYEYIKDSEIQEHIKSKIRGMGIRFVDLDSNVFAKDMPWVLINKNSPISQFLLKTGILNNIPKEYTNYYENLHKESLKEEDETFIVPQQPQGGFN